MQENNGMKENQERGYQRIEVNALGDTCPIPIVKAKNAIKTLTNPGVIEVLVDNEIAVQNLQKMAKQKGYPSEAEKLEERKYRVCMTIEAEHLAAEEKTGSGFDGQSTDAPETMSCSCEASGNTGSNTVVVVSSDKMGSGNDELGAVLMKGFIYAISQQEALPRTILFYNGGAKITSEGSASIEDLKYMESQGVTILTCGTCLDYYGLKEKLQVGGVTNMYVIAETMMQADKIVRP